MHLQELASITSKAPKTPNSYKDALASPDATHWQKVMQEEFEVLMCNRTYVLVPLPQGRKPISARVCMSLFSHCVVNNSHNSVMCTRPV